MDIDAIKVKTRANEFLLSDHADHEAADESIDIAEIRDAILNGAILQEYADTGAAKVVLFSALRMNGPSILSAVGAVIECW